MAGLKKKKKEKSGSPNTVLIVFLVMFVLVSIGLGVWGYYGYAGQEELRTKWRNAEASEKSMKRSKAYYEMLWGDRREAMGDITPEELQVLTLDRDEFYKPGFGPFKDEKNTAQAKKLIEDTHELLGLPKDAKGYEKNFKTVLAEANVKITNLSGDLDKQLKKNTRVESEIQKQNAKQDAFQAAAMTQIQKGNAAALAAAQAKAAAFADLKKQLDERTEAVAQANQKLEEAKIEHTNILNKLDRKMKQMARELADAKSEGIAGAANAARADSAPLVLDISQGRPLWDAPVGKVIRVEPDLRSVMINLGSAQGVKPQLTFNIFAATTGNRASGPLKGSIEVVRVIDSSSSVARVTSLYDAEGREIGFNSPTQSRIVRETEAPIKEGDLLFNLFWGARVAVTGYVSITGTPSENPAEQIQQTQDFVNLLIRQGMRVDAYVDLSDGQVKGQVSGKTRYLIRGDDLKAEQRKAAPMAEGDDDKDAAGGRIATVNKAGTVLRREATEKGVLIISAQNFATMIGYRKPHSASHDELSRFTPRLPYAGTNIGVMNAAPAAPDAPAQPKKDAEMKKEPDGN